MIIQQIKCQASHYVLSVFIAVFLGLAGAAGLWAAESPKVSVSPWPDKVLYDAGETAVIDVTIKNSTDKTVSGKLNVQVIWEIEESKALLNQAMEIKAGQTNAVSVKWENMPEVLGCEVRADFINDKGEAVASGSEYFNVCRHLDTCRVGIHGGGMDLQTYSNETYLKNIPGKIAFKRAHYLNIGEWYPAKSSVWNLAPKEDEWSGGFWNSKKALQLGIQEAHKHGMKAVVYATAFAMYGLDPVDVSLRHPDWILYDKTGRPAPEWTIVDVKTEDLLRSIETGAVKDKYTPACFTSIFGNWMVPEHLDFHIDQLIANAKMFGMDGVRYDGHPGVPSIFNAALLNVEGRPVTTAENCDKEADRILKHIKQRIRKELPNYLFMYNAGCVFRNVDSSGNIKEGMQEVPRDNGAWCDEEFRGAYSSYNEFHEWKKYADLLVNDVDVMRKVGGHAYGLFPWASTIHKNAIELGYSIMLATGDHPWSADPEHDDTSYPGGSPYPIQKELYAFATRFSAM
ncbi:MAG: hypothetical protein L6437_15945, partial [Kiritimatiellae bacterium]|nr:hypothetical protein [Kiritimatiellia bacterium]